MKTLDKFKNTLFESVVSTSDYKIGVDGRKYKAHRFTINKDSNDDTNTAIIQSESVSNMPKDPPFVLVLKREAIRYYPNNTKVALYYNAKLDKHFSVPYGPDISNPVIQTEEIEQIEEAVMDILHKIHNEKQAQRVKFADGSTRKVDGMTASAIVALHKALNPDAAEKLRDLVHKSPSHFAKASEFAFKHTTIK